MTLKNNAVKTGQHPRNQSGKLGDEQRYCIHGIPFPDDCLVTIILESRMPFFIIHGRWAKPTLRKSAFLFCAAISGVPVLQGRPSPMTVENPSAAGPCPVP